MYEYTGIQIIDLLLNQAEEQYDGNENEYLEIYHLESSWFFHQELPHVWRQFRTPDDSVFFGVFINDEDMQTLQYSNGEIMLVNCFDAETYEAELDRIRDQHLM